MAPGVGSHENAGIAWPLTGLLTLPKVGVCTVVPGPGILNAAAGLLTAAGTGTPVVCLTADVPTAFAGKGMGHLHELPDQLAMMRGITKWAERVDQPADAERLVGEAFFQMASGRPRPVALEMPENSW